MIKEVMSMKLSAMNQGWDTYFPSSTSQLIYNETSFNQTSGNFYFSFCVFMNITGAGVIRYDTTTNDTLLLEDCSFIKCTNNNNYNNDWGGSIYFKTNGSFVQDRTCFYKSKCIGRGTAELIELPSTKEHKLFVNFTSITACNTRTIGGTTPFYVFTGKEFVMNLNVTKNKCSEFCIICHDLDRYVEPKYKYIEVVDNKQDGTRAGLGMFIYSVSFYYMNFVRNSRPQSNYEGFINSRAGLNFYNNCIYENQGDAIFSSYSGWPIEIYSCYVDSPTKVDGYLSFNKRASEKFPFDSPTYGTNNCEVIYLSLNWKLITFDRKPQHNPFNQKTSVFTLFSRFLM